MENQSQLLPFEAAIRLVVKYGKAILKGHDLLKAGKEKVEQFQQAIEYLEGHPDELPERQAELNMAIRNKWVEYYKAESEYTKARLLYEQELAFVIDNIRRNDKRAAGVPKMTVGFAEAKAQRENETVKQYFEDLTNSKITMENIKQDARLMERTYWSKYGQEKQMYWHEVRDLHQQSGKGAGV